MLSIVIPDDSQLLATPPRDFHELAERLVNAPRRACLFFDEKITGFVLQTYAEGESPPTELYLTVFSAAGKRNVFSTATVFDMESLDHSVSSKVTDLVMSGQSDILGPENAAVWRFSVSVTNGSREESGSVRLAVSSKNPHAPARAEAENTASEAPDTAHKPETLEAAPGYRNEPENLLDQLNFAVSETPGSNFQFSLGSRPEITGNGTKSLDVKSPVSSHSLLGNGRNDTHIGPTLSQADTAVLDLHTSVPLQLKLRSTKPVGRNDIVVSTLSIEASQQLVAAAARSASMQYRLHILGVSVSTKGAKVSPLGSCMLPCTLAVHDALSVSYRLSDIENTGLANAGPAYAPSPTPATPSSHRSPLLESASIKMLEVEIDFRIERSDAISGDHVTVVQEKSCIKMPLVDVASSHLPNKVTMGPKRAATSFAPPKKAFSINNAASHSHRSPAERVAATLSSPILMSTKNQAKRNTQSSMSALPAHSSSVAINNNPASPFSGLVLTFTGDFSISVGEVVSWKVQVINRASRPIQASLQSRCTGAVPAHNPRGSHSGVSLGQLLVDDEKNVLTQSQAVQQYLWQRPDRTGIFILSSDISIGVLDPNSVYESEIRLVGLSKGVHTLSGLYMADAAGNSVDFGRLFEVFVT